MALFSLTFRHRGLIDWPRFYKEGRAFWLDIVDKEDIAEKKYKDKGNEFEGVWKITHTYDAYHRFEYEIDFKAQDMEKTDTDGVYNGKLRVYVSVDLEEHYGEKTMAGDTPLFKKPDGFLHKLYKLLTQREREEDLEDVGISTAQEYAAFLKELCKAEAQYG